MAAKLEAAVNNRGKNRLTQNCSKETVMPDNEAERAQKNFMRHLNYTCAGETEDLRELCKAYREVFWNINLAILGDGDLEKRFQFLKHAKSLALELINR